MVLWKTQIDHHRHPSSLLPVPSGPLINSVDSRVENCWFIQCLSCCHGNTLFPLHTNPRGVFPQCADHLISDSWKAKCLIWIRDKGPRDTPFYDFLIEWSQNCRLSRCFFASSSGEGPPWYYKHVFHSLFSLYRYKAHLHWKIHKTDFRDKWKEKLEAGKQTTMVILFGNV